MSRALLLLSPFSLGCSAALEAAAHQPLGDEAVVAAFPPDGAAHLLGNIPVLVALGGAAVDETPTVRARVGDGDERTLPCNLGFDGTWADCGVLSDVEGDDAVDVEVSVAGIVHRSTSRAELPEADVGWDILARSRVDRFGGSAAAADQLDGALDASQLFLVLDGYRGQPGDYPAFIAPAHDADDGIGLLEPGFSIALSGTVGDEGGLVARADTAWLPLSVEGEPFPFLMLDPTIRAEIDGDRLTSLTLSADIPAVAIATLADRLGPQGAAFEQLAVMDADHDGDGQAECLRLELHAEPEADVLDAWTR